MIHVGCSGWNYREWRGTFYPEGMATRQWLDFYARHFATVEINNSFYRLSPPATFAKWRAQTPAGFRFAVKANRILTHVKRLKDCAEPVAHMMASARALEDRLGPILYQLPPRLGFDPDRLEKFLAPLPQDIVHVFEFRDASWYREETLALLDRFGASFCAHDFPGLATGKRAVGPAAYIRFHGAQGKYRGRYGDAALAPWRDWMVAQHEEGRAVWAYFNNDMGGDAIADATTLRRLMEMPCAAQ